MKKITFVCTGNICRSPMAEYILRSRLGSESEWEVASAGTFAGDGYPASRAAVEVLQEWGIDASGHKSQLLTYDLVDESDVIVVMTSGHLLHIVTMFPDAEEKVFLLKSFNNDDSDVKDPIGASVDVYRMIRDEISDAMPGLQSFLENYNK